MSGIILNEIEGYKLSESKEGGYYLYKKGFGFGFTNAKEIMKVHLDGLENKPFWQTRELAGTCKMKSDVPDRYLICSTDYHLTLQDAIDYLLCKKVAPKPPKRKPITKEPASFKELNDYLGMEIFKENDS